VAIFSLDEGSDFVIDPDFFDEADFEDLDRVNYSPPLGGIGGNLRLPWFAIFFEGRYIAERSGHSRGSTVDLTLIEVHSDGSTEPLDMGTPFDFFDPSSATDSPDVTPRQRADRALLREYMEAGGFRNYEAEWWHYTLEDEPWPERYLDVVIR
jgi:D-alanyl-D-alanine dipeptidase